MATLQHAAPPAPLAGGPAAARGVLPPLLSELEQASPSYLEPSAFFVSWQGVLTLAYRGFTQPLLDLKQRILEAHPALPPENPGSRWPKTSLGCLRDGCRLTPPQLQLLCRVCEEQSAAFQPQASQQQQQQQQQQEQPPPGAPAAAAAAAATGAPGVGGMRLAVDSAAVVLFECRSLERLLSCQPVRFQGPLSEAAASEEEQSRVAAILAEPQSPGYWFAASRDGNRESHYRGAHLGATLAHPLLPEYWGMGGGGWGGGTDAGAAGLLAAQGVLERGERRALLEAVARFRAAVEAALPGMYVWFSEASLHITLRALIN